MILLYFIQSHLSHNLPEPVEVFQLLLDPERLNLFAIAEPVAVFLDVVKELNNLLFSWKLKVEFFPHLSLRLHPGVIDYRSKRTGSFCAGKARTSQPLQ